jgi:hypothetical protein
MHIKSVDEIITIVIIAQNIWIFDIYRETILNDHTFCLQNAVFNYRWFTPPIASNRWSFNAGGLSKDV